jgi:hypothetical protein
MAGGAVRFVITMVLAIGALLWITFNIDLNELPAAPIVRPPPAKPVPVQSNKQAKGPKWKNAF